MARDFDRVTDSAREPRHDGCSPRVMTASSNVHDSNVHDGDHHNVHHNVHVTKRGV